MLLCKLPINACKPYSSSWKSSMFIFVLSLSLIFFYTLTISFLTAAILPSILSYISSLAYFKSFLNSFCKLEMPLCSSSKSSLYATTFNISLLCCLSASISTPASILMFSSLSSFRMSGCSFSVSSLVYTSAIYFLSLLMYFVWSLKASSSMTMSLLSLLIYLNNISVC